MKRSRVILAAVLVLAASVLGGTKFANAASFRTGDNVTTPSGQVTNSTVYAAGKTIDISSEINGDLFCAGQSVNISGIVHGDVICAAQSLTVTGRVDGDVRLAGQSVTLGATVDGSATVAGQSFVMNATGRVARDLTLGSNDSTVNGTIGRDVVLGGTTAVLGGQIGRDVNASTTKFTISNSARINGNVALSSRNEPVQQKGSVVLGQVTRTEPKDSNNNSGLLFQLGFGAFLYWAVALLLLALLLTLLFPRLLQATTNRARPTPWKALLTGFASGLAVFAVIIALSISFVGLPIAALLGLTWTVVLILSGPLFAFYIGRLILRGDTNAVLVMLVGSIVLLVLYLIPVINIIAVLAAIWTGSGMIVLECFKRTPKPVYQIPAIEER